MQDTSPKRRDRRLVVALLALTLIVAGCGSSSPATPSPASSQAAASTGPETCRDLGKGPLVVESSGSLVGQAEQVAYKNPFTAECGVEIQTVDAVADAGA